MPDSYPFTTYTGILTPEHYKRIGSAIWLFLWCVSSTTKEKEKDGIVWGIVKGNKPHKMAELAELFDVSTKTVSRWMKDLENEDYIRVTRAPYGMIITVKNSKRGYIKRSDKNVHSPQEQTNSSTQEQTEMSGLLDKNVHSNKDGLEIINTTTTADARSDSATEASDGVPTTDQKGESASADEISHTSPEELILDNFITLRGQGLMASTKDQEAAKEIVAAGVEPQDACTWMEEKFQQYKPRHNRDKIQTLDYCVGYILDKHYEKHARKEAAASGPSTNQHAGGYGKTQGTGGASQERSITGGQVGRIRPGKRA